MGKTWESFPAVRRDVEMAEGLLEENGTVTARQWAALVWKWTNIPTARICRNLEGRAVGLVTEVSRVAGVEVSVSYLTAAHIAKQEHVWHQASGGEMLRWVTYISEEQARQLAWNYAHGEYRFDVEGLASWADEIKARLDKLARQKGLQQPPVTKPLPFSEPPEQFAKELEQLRDKAMDGFFDGAKSAA